MKNWEENNKFTYKSMHHIFEKCVFFYRNDYILAQFEFFQYFVKKIEKFMKLNLQQMNLSRH